MNHLSTQTSNLKPQTSIAIVDYGLGNLRSVANAFAAIGHPATLTADPKVIMKAARVVLPGVGAAGEAMRRLRELGLDGALREAIASGKPTLGLCLGMQLLFDYSEENDTTCLGILRGAVTRLQPTEPATYNLQSTFKVPHIGWAQLSACSPHPLLNGMDGEYIYFVHGYACQPTEPDIALATADYGGEFIAIAGCENVIAVQGHPERSDVVGLGFLKRFAEWKVLYANYPCHRYSRWPLRASLQRRLRK